MMEKANQDIRELLQKKRIYQWEVAEEIGMKDSNFTRLLRTPLKDEMKRKILSAIKKIEDRNRED